MSTQHPSQFVAALEDLEDLWRRLDQILDSLEQADWRRKHGKDWTYADLPYHLAYFDRDLIAFGLERGSDMQPGERLVFHSMGDVDAWNARQFAVRPVGLTVEQSCAQMRAGREAIRRALGPLAGASGERPVWFPFDGWITAADLIDACLAHTWRHFTELRLRLKRRSPEPLPSQTRRALGNFLGYMPLMLNREQAVGKDFTAVLRFSGEGGGAWTIQVANGICTVRARQPEHADLVLTQSPETFTAISVHMQHPLLALLTGKMRVRGFRQMGTFGKLFPHPRPDQQWALPADREEAAIA